MSVDLGLRTNPWCNMNIGSIDRILAAVGESFVPPTLDQRALRYHLGWCATSYLTRTQLRAPALNKQRRQFGAITKTGKRLKQLLSDADVWRSISGEVPEDHACPQRAVEDVVRAAERSMPGLTARNERPIEDFNRCSPFEWLAGERLPRLYLQYFAQKAGISRIDGRVDGPYVRFVEQVLIEFNIMWRGRPYAPEAIAGALTYARSGRTRRGSRD